MERRLWVVGLVVTYLLLFGLLAWLAVTRPRSLALGTLATLVIYSPVLWQKWRDRR